MMFRKSLKILVLSLLVLSATAVSCQGNLPDEKDDHMIIPLDLSTQRPVLELYIGTNGPYRFIFDTGSGGSLIDTELARDLKLDVVGEDTLYTPGSDRTRTSKQVKVPMINFPNATTFENVVMNTIDIRKMVSVDGIINTSFFADYLLTISYPQSKLMVTVGELDSTEKDVIHYMPKQRIINLSITVDGHPVEAHLDSGSPGGFGIPYALKDKLNFISEPIETGVIHTPVASFKRWRAKLKGTIRVGNVVYENPEVNLVENFEFVNLGYQFAKDLTITIDTKNKLIKFEKAITTMAKNESDDSIEVQNMYTGWYGGHERRIFLENGEMYLQRNNAPKLKLVKLEENLYEMTFGIPVMNELPTIRFKLNENNEVIGFTFLFKGGKEDFVSKDQ